MESLTDVHSLIVRPIRGEERKTWDQLMATNHYLGFRRLVGESIRYVALLNGQWVALLGWSSAAYKSGPPRRLNCRVGRSGPAGLGLWTAPDA
jgi:hypothetical protein